MYDYIVVFTGRDGLSRLTCSTDSSFAAIRATFDYVLRELGYYPSILCVHQIDQNSGQDSVQNVGQI